MKKQIIEISPNKLDQNKKIQEESFLIILAIVLIGILFCVGSFIKGDAIK